MDHMTIFLEALPQWEEKVPWLYRDTVGLPTTAEGLQVENLAASIALPWYCGDRRAFDDEVEADWNRVMAMPEARVASFYRSTQSALTLMDADIAALTLQIAQKQDAVLAQDFCSYTAAPDQAKAALQDMDWNLGLAKLRGTYPRFDAAFDEGHWAVCAVECGRNTSMAAFAARNHWTADLFNQAAKGGQ